MIDFRFVVFIVYTLYCWLTWITVWLGFMVGIDVFCLVLILGLLLGLRFCLVVCKFLLFSFMFCLVLCILLVCLILFYLFDFGGFVVLFKFVVFELAFVGLYWCVFLMWLWLCVRILGFLSFNYMGCYVFCYFDVYWYYFVLNCFNVWCLVGWYVFTLVCVVCVYFDFVLLQLVIYEVGGFCCFCAWICV